MNYAGIFCSITATQLQRSVSNVAGYLSYTSPQWKRNCWTCERARGSRASQSDGLCSVLSVLLNHYSSLFCTLSSGHRTDLGIWYYSARVVIIIMWLTLWPMRSHEDLTEWMFFPRKLLANSSALDCMTISSDKFLTLSYYIVYYYFYKRTICGLACCGYGAVHRTILHFSSEL